jgi:DNA-binding NarL/FixJ family response regulator
VSSSQPNAAEVPRPIRLLIVEDDVPTRIGLRAIFGAEPDIDVVGESADGIDACRRANELSPDVVLMDIQLPERDGIEATKVIVSNAAADAHVPKVIVLTTFALDEYAYRSLEAGASGFLLKRTRAEDIIEAVRVAVAGDALPTPMLTRPLIQRFAQIKTAPFHQRSVRALTEREVEVLELIAQGCSNAEIAQMLAISVDTVKSHVKHVFTKLEVRDRAQAVIAAYESGLVSPGF